MPVALENNDVFRLYTFVPLAEGGITWLGLLDKYICPKSITGFDGDTVTFYEGGTLAFVTEQPVRVFSKTRELHVKRSGILCTVDAQPEETTLQIRQ